MNEEPIADRKMSDADVEALGDAVARGLARRLGLADTDELRLDLQWLRRQRTRCARVQAWITARVGEVAKWALWGSLAMIGVWVSGVGREALRAWLALP